MSRDSENIFKRLRFESMDSITDLHRGIYALDLLSIAAYWNSGNEVASRVYLG